MPGATRMHHIWAVFVGAFIKTIMVKASNAPTSCMILKLITALRVRTMFFFSRRGSVGMSVVFIGRWELGALLVFALNEYGFSMAEPRLTQDAHSIECKAPPASAF